VLIDQVLRAQEPLALPLLRFVALLGPGFLCRRMRREVEIAVGGVVAVVGYARVRALLVGALVGLPPVVAAPDVFADAEAHPLGARGLAPLADNVALGTHLDGVPAAVARVPKVEVVAVDAHADEVLRAGLAVQARESLGVEALGLPQRNGVLVAELRRVAVGLQMILVLAAALHVHVARVPVAGADGGRRSPMRPEAEFGVAEPLRAGVLLERAISGLEGPRLNGNAGIAPSACHTGERRCACNFEQVSTRPVHGDHRPIIFLGDRAPSPRAGHSSLVSAQPERPTETIIRRPFRPMRILVMLS
jgi:hypothetical protein